ncbi:MAG: NAD(P)-dependent oxidoreductase [Chloroflexota bacterium]|jgi:phosphoglycerate dehydrogenase-like enzyme
MALNVYYLHPPAQEFLAYLEPRLSPEIKFSAGEDQTVPVNSQILIAGRPKREQLLELPKLEKLIIPWAGIPPDTRQLMLDFPDIAVHNLHHNAAPVAEMVLALLLAAAKFIVPMDRSLRANDWRPRYWPTPALLLKDKTALILGYGAIGRRVAGLCQQLGMRVLAIKRRPTAETGPADEIHPPADLHQLLPQTDALLICLPHTPETDGLIGQDELELLPDKAVLVNVGRGSIVVEGALYQALRDGRLYAAGLDVWYNYPDDEESRADTAPANYPFHELDNVVMSPHRGGSTTESNFLRMESLACLLNKAARGEPFPNRVDIEVGY